MQYSYKPALRLCLNELASTPRAIATALGKPDLNIDALSDKESLRATRTLTQRLHTTLATLENEVLNYEVHSRLEKFPELLKVVLALAPYLREYKFAADVLVLKYRKIPCALLESYGVTTGEHTYEHDLYFRQLTTCLGTGKSCESFIKPTLYIGVDMVADATDW